MNNTKRKIKNKNSNQKQPLHHVRNDGIPFDASLFEDINVNRSAVERRAATLGNRRSVKKQWQAAWLLKAVSCIDLTTLSGDDTESNVLRLCAKAKSPVRLDILESLGMQDANIQTGAVCVYHNFIKDAVKGLKGSNITNCCSIYRISSR